MGTQTILANVAEITRCISSASANIFFMNASGLKALRSFSWELSATLLSPLLTHPILGLQYIQL